jgi:hypothetical protein
VFKALFNPAEEEARRKAPNTNNNQEIGNRNDHLNGKKMDFKQFIPMVNTKY